MYCCQSPEVPHGTALCLQVKQVFASHLLDKRCSPAGLMAVLLAVYFLLICFYSFRAFSGLAKYSYQSYRVGNMIIR